MPDAHKNFAYTTISVPPDPADSGTSWTVDPGQGGLMPATPFNGVVWPPGAQPTVLNAEIVRVESRTADHFDSVDRGQEGTTPISIKAGYQFAAAATAKTFTDIETLLSSVGSGLTAHAAATTSVHGIADTSKLVVTTDTRLKTLFVSSQRPFVAAAGNLSAVVYIRGYDAVDDRLFGTDTSAGQLKQSTDGGATWSTNKGTPTNVPYNQVVKIVRGPDGNLYLFGFNTVSNKCGVYRAAPAAGNTAFSWSTALYEQDASVTATIMTNFSADATALYLGEYGDPTGGPLIMRSLDGTTWTTSFARDATLRHCHAIAPDPYNPGHVWMTLGDGGSKTVMKSTDYGVTWAVVIANFAWQGVQISFDATWVYIAGDQETSTFYVIDRTSATPYIGSPNWHANTPQTSLTGSKTWDPPSVADGAMTSTTVTVTGVAFGDFIRASFSQALPAGMQLTAEVTAANTVTVTLVNHSGGTLDIASGTLRVMTIPMPFWRGAYMGAVDPATGAYYCVANDTASTNGLAMGMFYCPKAGRRIELLDRGGAGISMNGQVFIADGKIFSGFWNHALVTPVPVG